jgi:hypothetical protein
LVTMRKPTKCWQGLINYPEMITVNKIYIRAYNQYLLQKKRGCDLGKTASSLKKN